MSHPSPPEDFHPVVSRRDWGGRATRAEVNLEAIEANIRGLVAHVRGREVMAVVKADGYGHGASWIGRAALEAGATRLAVYTVDEGVALRRAGITAPVLVFGPFEDSEAGKLTAHDLTATVTSARAAEALARVPGGKTIRVHLKVDSGLTRAGASVDEIVTLADRVGQIGSIELEGIYTHFARADEPDEATTASQIAAFRAALERLRGAGHTFGVVHLANSAGTLWSADGWKDMVRVGIAMYGCSPNPAIPSPVALRPALSLLSTVARVTSVEPGTGVGYGHTFRATRRSRIALVPIGYGDGLHRALGNGAGSVLIREERAPIVGRVSMDQITVDVTEVPGVAVGDAVTIIGRQGAAVQTADDLARALDTISYEVLTSVQGRVPRLYASGGRVVGARTLGKDEPIASANGTERE